MLRSLVVHLSRYSSANFLLMIAGLASFPFLTRMLTLEEYGYLSLIGATLTVSVGLGKSGLQHSAVRFYAESKNDWAHHISFINTTLLGIAVLGVIVSFCLYFFGFFIYSDFWNQPILSSTLFSVAALVFIRVLDSGLINIFRAEESSGFVSIYQVLKRYLTLGTVVLFFLFYYSTLSSFYTIHLVIELTLVIFLLYKLLIKYRLSIKFFNFDMFKSMMLYGLPMLGYELFGTVLNLGDRYILQFLKGAESVGIYSASYNLCEYAQNVIVAAISSAILPMYLRIWVEDGAEKTKEFLEQSLHVFIILGFPIIAGLSAVGVELITLLASDLYLPGVKIIPYIIASMVFQGGAIIFAAGLYISKQSASLMKMMFFTALLNIALNFLLIPHFNIEGAAIATLISFVGMGIFSYFYAAKIIRIAIPVVLCLKIGLISLLMYLVISNIQLDGILLTLLTKLAVGVLIYIALVLFFDSKSRLLLSRVKNKIVF